eukprot:2505941-Pleurochrysis_carterae.AAC.1
MNWPLKASPCRNKHRNELRVALLRESLSFAAGSGLLPIVICPFTLSTAAAVDSSGCPHTPSCSTDCPCAWPGASLASRERGVTSSGAIVVGSAAPNASCSSSRSSSDSRELS